MTTAGKPRSSGIPTPGRFRSYSSSHPAHDPLPPDVDATRAFADAMKSNDPSRYSARSVSANNPPVHRPPSVASSSHSRPKTPSGQFNKRISLPRPESQASEHASHKKKDFVVGDDVRIESLGFEGKLRYVGEIARKQGLWAGVELSGGFAGLGKNNGSVGNVAYFSCAEKCGVFIAYSKLSAPTVSRGSHSRSSSAASSRASLPGPGSYTASRSASSLHNGRVTPIDHGRVTPAKSNGRVTPSSSSLDISSSMAGGTIKRPSFGLPSAANTPSTSAMFKITAGSRASKYVGVTAQQLSARSQRTGTPGSPTKSSIGLGSPSRLRGPPSPSRSDSRSSSGGAGPGTPSGTPKPATRLSFGTPRSFGSGRPSLTATPRARIPSAVAMPPPPSPPNSGAGQRSISLNDKPATPTFSTTSNETAVDDDAPDSLANIQNNSKALQDKIQGLLSSKTKRQQSPSRRSSTTALQEDPVFSSPKFDKSMQVLQERVQGLEQENSKLKSELEQSRSTALDAAATESLTAERDQALDRVKELESQLKSSERTIDERNSKVESLERSVQSTNKTLETLRAEDDARVKDLQTKLEDSQSLIASLKEAVEAKANEAGQNEGLLQAKDAEIALLEGRVKKGASDLEETRKELTAQIDELRQAGQETIALYEERLAAADTRRYQLEDIIDQLEEKLKRLGSLSKSVSGHESVEAMRIDNEALREQVTHLQNKIASLDDLLEETRNSLEKEETIVRNRVQRYKDSEVALKGELTQMRGEVERLTKSESFARVKAEEAEEALRENTITLENAQAEIEGLRAEIAALENQARNSSERSRGDESARVLAIERDRHSEEVSQLKDLLEAARNARKEAVQGLDAAKQDALSSSSSVSSLKQTVESLDAEKADLEHARDDLTSKLDRERTVVAELRRALDEKTAELESARKSHNRDRPINVGLQDVSSSSSASPPTKEYKEEIKGLKHIVQELQKEISTLSARNKVLESENKMLTGETDTLRQELKVLEENVEQKLLDEERALDSVPGEGSSDRNSQAEIERLRKQLSEAEKKSARTIHELNKEVSELESLVEAKIYREDELEREIERLRQKGTRSSRSNKSSTEPPHHSATSSTNTISLHTNGSSSSISGNKDARRGSVAEGGEAETESDVCEICEAPGHDIFSCPLLKDGSDSVVSGKGGGGRGAPVETELYCEDCDGRGHVAADCPYSSDVF